MDVNEILAIAQAKKRFAAENTEELRDSLQSLLPPCDHVVYDIKGSPESFLALFGVDLKSEAEVQKFLKDYGAVTKEELKIANTV